MHSTITFGASAGISVGVGVGVAVGVGAAVGVGVGVAVGVGVGVASISYNAITIISSVTFEKSLLHPMKLYPVLVGSAGAVAEPP